MIVLLALALQTAGGAPEAGPAEAARLFDLGTTLVAEGDTAGAVAAWEGALATGWASAAAEHNLGTVALLQGDVPTARLHLERAARLAPGDAQIRHNLQVARERAGEPAPSMVRRLWERALAAVPPVALVALALALAFGALALRLAGRLRWASGVGLGAAVVVLVTVAVLAEATRPLGVVLAPDVTVTEAPSAGAPSVARLRAGEAVAVGPEVEGWRRVRVGRTRGWVPSDAVAPI